MESFGRSYPQTERGVSAQIFFNKLIKLGMGQQILHHFLFKVVFITKSEHVSKNKEKKVSPLSSQKLKQYPDPPTNN